MRVRDVPPSIKRFFPWSLFLIAAAVLGYLAFINRAHGREFNYECFGAGRYDAMSRGFGPEDCPKKGEEFDSRDGHYRKPAKPSWADYTCAKLHSYLAEHSEAEARAKAIELHLPQWVVRRAEKCIP